jgi:TPR repeat protein
MRGFLAVLLPVLASVALDAATASPDSELVRRNEKAIRKAFPDSRSKAREEEERILTFILESGDSDAERNVLLEQNLRRLDVMARRGIDSDGDGIDDVEDPMPGVASSPLLWWIEEIAVAWSGAAGLDAAVRDALLSETSARIEFDRAGRLTLYSRALCSADGDPSRLSDFSAYPLASARPGGQAVAEAAWRLGVMGSDEIPWGVWSTERTRAAAALARAVVKAGGRAPTMHIRLRLVNACDRPMVGRGIEVPVVLAGREAGWAFPLDPTVAGNGFALERGKPAGADLVLRLSLDGSAARRWMEDHPDVAPRANLCRCRGRLEIGGGPRGLDIRAQWAAIESRTVPLTVDGGDGRPLVWRIARRVGDRRLRITDALAELNAASQQALAAPLLVGEQGVPISLAAWDSGRWGRWWWVLRDGRPVADAKWTGEYVEDPIRFERRAALPPQAAAVASGRMPDHPVLQFLCGQHAWDRGDRAAGRMAFGRAAAEGFAPAQTWYGLCLLDGQGGGTNAAEAVASFGKAAVQQYAPGQVWLARCFQRGAGIPADAVQGVAWLRRAAEQGYPEAQVRLALALAGGGEQARIEAEARLRSAACLGYVRGQVAAGHFLLGRKGEGEAAAWREAAGWFRLAAEQGDATGQAALADCLDRGCGMARDSRAAVDWYRRAADAGVAAAQAGLGRCYRDGRGVRASASRSAKWFRLAAAQGDAAAQAAYALALYEGRGVRQDLAAAAEWFRKAAEQGDADGEQGYGVCLLDGQGVAADPVAGVNCLRPAAEQGRPVAQVRLGVCLLQGTGTNADPTEAVNWFRRAAEQGLGAGQMWLGYACLNGIGTPADPELARQWLRRAADQKQPGAAELLSRVPAP